MSEKALLLKGGTVIDPINKLNGKVDVLVRNGLVAKVAADIRPEEGWQVEDVTGLYVSPGWIDIHVHATADLTHSGLEPDDIGIRTGVTTIGDAGSVGALGVKALKRYVADPAKTSVVLLLNAGMATGMATRGTYADVRNVNIKAALQAVAAFPDFIKGIKIMASITQVGDNGFEPVKIAKKMASLAGVPLMVHIGNPPPVIEDVLNLLGEGDIVTHTFHGKPGGILDRHGKVIPEAWAARKRGVWFDVGHGSESFSFETYKKAVADGFIPDSISTDLHTGNYKGPVFDMGTTMSKFLNLGMPLEQVIDQSTRRPASVLKLPVGHLTPGAVADVTVFKVVDETVTLKDSEKATMQGSKMIRPVLTVKSGTKVWSA